MINIEKIRESTATQFKQLPFGIKASAMTWLKVMSESAADVYNSYTQITVAELFGNSEEAISNALYALKCIYAMSVEYPIKRDKYHIRILQYISCWQESTVTFMLGDSFAEYLNVNNELNTLLDAIADN